MSKWEIQLYTKAFTIFCTNFSLIKSNVPTNVLIMIFIARIEVKRVWKSIIYGETIHLLISIFHIELLVGTLTMKVNNILSIFNRLKNRRNRISDH